MARVPSKHGRDQPLDFQGFLNDLQDWELSVKDKDKKMKTQGSHKRDGVPGGSKSFVGGSTMFDSPATSSTQFDYKKHYDASGVSSSFMAEDDVPTAASEKELGNEYFKQKKFKEAIDCYSRSIAFSPTAVAYANRAMAYIKLRRFKEAEEDCTEALNLDDRYIKAYSRRATARKELGKLKESTEDAEFALKLEPNNQELKKQYTEAKSLYEKEICQKVTGAIRNSVTGVQKAESHGTKTNGHADSINRKKPLVAAVKEDDKKKIHGQTVARKPISVEKVQGEDTRSKPKDDDLAVTATNGSAAMKSSIKKNHKTLKQEQSILDLAARAASRSSAEAAKNIRPPTSAFQFEVSWKGLSADRALQAHLLKVTSPSALPQIFKNALSAPMLIDIVKCVSTFFIEDMDLAVKYMENLTKVPRFDILIMGLSSAEKAELRNAWDEVLCDQATPIEYAEVLDKLRSRYCLK